MKVMVEDTTNNKRMLCIFESKLNLWNIFWLIEIINIYLLSNLISIIISEYSYITCSSTFSDAISWSGIVIYSCLVTALNWTISLQHGSIGFLPLYVILSVMKRHFGLSGFMLCYKSCWRKRKFSRVCLEVKDPETWVSSLLAL